jgi:hypothetical protein
MPTLIAKSVTFYSLGDEAVFFGWLKAITCIGEITGIGGELHLKIKRRHISRSDLRDLIAISFRYGIAMRQLAQFQTDKNEIWFKNKHAYWHKEIFGTKRP